MIGIEGAQGAIAVNMLIELEGLLYPTILRAKTLNWYVRPGWSPVAVYD